MLLDFIKPGRPMENGFIERFDRSYDEAVLDCLYVKDCRKRAAYSMTCAKSGSGEIN
jgi:hypothetical protein